MANPQHLSLEEYTAFWTEITEQPQWRAEADRQADYIDGNQLDAEILQRMKTLGIPPAIEPLMGPVLASVLGMEVRNRGDWKVRPQSQEDSADVADALNYKLHEAEQRSKADIACSEAFKSQIGPGIGWVYVGREEDPFKYPYRVEQVPRNEMFWDWFAKPDMSDARYMIRRRWFDKRIPELVFPQHRDLIKHTVSSWSEYGLGHSIDDGGMLPDLSYSQEQEREWSIEEMQWRNTAQNRVAICECWYRRWDRVTVIRSPDGRVAEFDRKNSAHVVAVAQGIVSVEQALVSRIKLSWWLGPHKLADVEHPEQHNKFPYVPFWAMREDRTGVPFGLARGMVYLQDQVNALHSKLQWMLAARRVERTEGAVVGDDEQFRQEVARPDADIILSAKAMRDGGIFKVETDLQLSAQQFQRLSDSREALRRVGGIYSEFQGQNSNTTSGVQFNSQVDQSNQSLADVLDNFKNARTEVGELLLALIIADTIGKQEQVFLSGNGLVEDRTIALNTPTTDEDGIDYLDNDVSRVALTVGIDDVQSSATFTQQQLTALSEAFQVMPPKFQSVTLPFMLALMDLPNRDDLIREIKAAAGSTSPEQIEQMIQDAVEQERMKSRTELEIQKIRQQQPLIDAQVSKVAAEAATKAVEGFFSATRAANEIAMMPQLAQSADQILRSAGMPDKDAAPLIAPVPAGAYHADLPQNTSPLFPANPDVGLNTGIEQSGV